MEYSKIIAVTGLPGLYELLNSKSDGAIVRSLDDKTSKFVSNRIHNFSHLESIEVYTTAENTNLVDVLKAMDASKEKLPDEKDSNALKNYFKAVYPSIDFDRVYASDLKKMVKWFSVLKNNNIEFKVSEQVVEEPTPIVEEEEKPAPKKVAEPKEKKKEKEITAEEVKPKKARAKKTAEPKEPKKEKEITEEEVKPKKAPAKKKTKE